MGRFALFAKKCLNEFLQRAKGLKGPKKGLSALKKIKNAPIFFLGTDKIFNF